jgi:glycosyltransferase involved in cell wall biosynthesis
LLLWRNTASRVFYVACEGGLGLIYTLTLTTAARMTRASIFIHHHSFAYIDKHSPLMSCLTAIAGSRATHIFLCPTMAERFAKQYPARFQHSILSNSAFVAPVSLPPRDRIPEEPLIIGLLSNLNNEKGLQIFIDLVREAKAQGLNISAILAGPPHSGTDRDLIDRGCHELGAKLDYLGPVYADAKDAFFRAIDIFIFPTRYANEAQPTVLFEALSYGIPVLSFDRGCISHQIGDKGAILERDGDFVPFALTWLKKWLSEPDVFARLRLDAQASFMEERKQSRLRVTRLFD